MIINGGCYFLVTVAFVSFASVFACVFSANHLVLELIGGLDPRTEASERTLQCWAVDGSWVGLSPLELRWKLARPRGGVRRWACLVTGVDKAHGD